MTVLHSGIFGVTFAQFLPSSVVTWTNPSSVPAQIVPCFFGDSASAKIGVVIFHAGDVVGERTAAWLLFRFVIFRQVVADLSPALAVIGGFENAFRRGVDHIWIMR